MIDVDITLTIQDGARRFDLAARFATEASFVALYGPSGSGKTLTLQAVAGLRKPTAGRIALGGRTLFDAERGIDVPPPRRRIGYLFQHYALFPHLTVRQNIGFGLGSWCRRPSPADERRVDELMQRFGLTDMAGSRPAALSGGQQQRVALARALACEPDALLLDEPFAALNPMLRGALRKELAEVARQWKIPVLMITHDVDDVLELAEVAFIYEGGQIVKEVNVRDGSSRVLARRALGDEASVETPMRRKLRHLLGDGAAVG
ncbi:sulfate/molybdate ABC transporter ATP-binding protein [Pigmentiphaga sp.]|jgi:ABC-type sulfate/molybdate transport systems, ATPase component|uniref:sulfate/molybdate ABC transporter ATP-binding protein n=1 Tax=Pigmentiphaga sp. TaxID=1977564 RepID=UPI0025CF98D8|nr:ATP-binding cassette domain-containing protein [Pigmentiphaga sp.]MBX6318280.1 ATP-binding cassette domain-containing protein [Pigmentiphaga sp.]